MQNIQLSSVNIEGETFYADLVGLTPNGTLACLGFVGRRTGVDRALVHLHRGECLSVDGAPTRTLGEKAYRVVRGHVPGRQRLVRACVLPATAIRKAHASHPQQGRGEDGSGEGGDQPDPPREDRMEQVLIWREREHHKHHTGGGNTKDVDAVSPTRQALWNWLQKSTSIPLLDEWSEALLDRLAKVNVVDDPDNDDADETGAVQPALGDICFAPPGDGRWHGVVANISDDRVASVVQAMLRDGTLAVPGITAQGDTKDFAMTRRAVA
ncbi:MAG: hypothetical protein L0H29_00355 [Sinobacteraceae bacterium]|nr:hypothetical protein [Nevskiaceae bacterium]